MIICSSPARRRSTAAIELPKNLSIENKRAEIVHHNNLMDRRDSSLIPVVPSFSDGKPPY